MNGIPAVNSATQKLIDEYTEAVDKLKKHNLLQQDQCSHSVVLEAHIGNDMRLCPECGREEHTPYYHSFYFVQLGNSAARLVVPVDTSVMYSYRIPQNSIWFNGAQ